MVELNLLIQRHIGYLFKHSHKLMRGAGLSEYRGTGLSEDGAVISEEKPVDEELTVK